MFDLAHRTKVFYNVFALSNEVWNMSSFDYVFTLMYGFTHLTFVVSLYLESWALMQSYLDQGILAQRVLWDMHMVLYCP